MPSDKPRVTTYLRQEMYDRLATIAERENRSVSNLVYEIIDNYLISTPEHSTVKEFDAKAFFNLAGKGKRPTDEEIEVLAKSLSMDEEVLRSLRDRMFPTRRKNPKKSKN